MRSQSAGQELVVDMHGQREGDPDGVQDKVNAQVIVAVDSPRETEDDAKGDNLRVSVSVVNPNKKEGITHLSNNSECFGEQRAALTTSKAMNARS